MKWNSRKFVITFIFCTGAAIAGAWMIYIAQNFEQIRDSVSTVLQFQRGAIGAYQGSNVIAKFPNRNQPSNIDGE